MSRKESKALLGLQDPIWLDDLQKLFLGQKKTFQGYNRFLKLLAIKSIKNSL